MRLRPCRVCGQMGRYYPSIIIRPGMTANREPPVCDVCDGLGAIPPDRPGVEQAMAELRVRLQK